MRIFKNIFSKRKKDKSESGSKKIGLVNTENTSYPTQSKLKFIYNGLKEFYPYSFDELEQSLKLEFDLDNKLNYWIKVVEQFNKLSIEPKNKNKIRLDILGDSFRAIKKENNQIMYYPLFEKCLDIRFQEFIKSRSQKGSFELRKVELTTSNRRQSYDGGYSCRCEDTKSTFEISPNRYLYEHMKKLITGQTCDIFTARFMKCGVIVSNNSFLIEPLFNNIHYYARHNVFCGLIKDNEKRNTDFDNTTYHKKYFFDVLGNLIFETRGEYKTRFLPEIGINYNLPEENNIVEIKAELVNRDYRKIFSSSYYTNNNSYEGTTGLINNNNDQILPKKYGDLIVFEKEQTILASKDDKVYLFQLNNIDVVKTLECNTFIDDNDYTKEEEISPYTRVVKKNQTEYENEIIDLWGLINAQGEYQIPSEYNYLERSNNLNYYKVFKAPALSDNHLNWFEQEGELFSYNNTEESYNWWSDYESGSFTSCLYVISSWKGNYLGIVDINNNVIIPKKYSWIEFISSKLLEVSIDSEVINYYDKDGDGENTYVMGGKFGVMDINNKLIVPLEYDIIQLREEKIYAQKTSSHTLNKDEPYDIYDFNGNKT
ncbi:WG repeat-containing protein [uncultured Dokdonia sp.]|uniref:WG repeat-containing protein n=1 Tax=uncultured Dokdonia sp. TaxID=575653 RepID=UPI00261D4773|nr:WG repeat-containing protein [uncultured Dokdonia sp.]